MPEVLAFALGLHVPKAFSLYYLLLGWLAWRSRGAPLPDLWIRLSAALVLAFGLSYAVMSVHFGFWQLGGRDLLDLISMLLLPAAGVWLGALVAVRTSWRSMGWLWLAYGLGALAYTWAVLLHGRGLPLLLEARRVSTIAVPWGSDPLVNVRSIEQNAALVVTWWLPGLWLLLRERQKLLGGLLLACATAGLAAVVCFHGRLGYLMLLVGDLPLAWLMRRSAWLWRTLLTGSAAVVGVLIWKPQLAQRLYDERFDRFAGFFPVAPQFPWGGNQLHFEGGLAFDARQGELMHNVLLDIYVRVGWLPLLLLSLALLPLLWRALQALALGLSQSEQRGGALLAASLLLCLTVQWLFQPLIFADGLLFYFGFLLLGFLAAKSHELQR